MLLPEEPFILDTDAVLLFSRWARSASWAADLRAGNFKLFYSDDDGAFLRSAY